MGEVQLTEKIARVTDILEQIERLNQMVDFHKHQSGEKSMVRQYEEMRNAFLQELEEILIFFKIKVQIKSSAA